jgi:hypothetical protein
MKANWEEGHGAKADWMPPFTEWDFRTIQERESRLACCWEYARSTRSIGNNFSAWIDGAGGTTALGNFICNNGMRFPEPWVMVGDDVSSIADRFEAEEAPISIYSLKERKAILLQEVARAQEEGRDVREVVARLFPEEGYAMFIAFGRWGIVAMVKWLTRWLRQEAKNHAPVRRGKGAAPPFEWLKWLAALRLEAARNEAGASYEELMAALAEHQRSYPIANASPTLPLYSGHGAWSKAIGDARKSLALLESDPLKFEKRILLF